MEVDAADAMGMIEFEDHSEENQRDLLAYLDGQLPDRMTPVRARSTGTGMLARLFRQLRLTFGLGVQVVAKIQWERRIPTGLQ